MIKIKQLALTIFVLLGVSKGFSATCTATVTGNWENASVWSCGRVPLCTDNVVIPSGYTVTITTQLDYNTAGCTTQTMVISISGVLKFQSGKKLTLPSASKIFIGTGGSLQPGGGGGSSNLITIGNTDVWKAGDGPISGPAIVTSGGLPIELVYFRANITDNKAVKLDWVTASESNNDYFVVEGSTDGINFEYLNIIPSKSVNGNSVQKLSYESYDNKPKAGINYYRLKQVDFDNMFKYSQIQFVDYSETKDFSFVIFPNPNEGNTFNITLHGIENSETAITVYGATGREVLAKTLKSLESNGSTYAINFGKKLTPGIYMVVLTSGGKTFTKRLVVN